MSELESARTGSKRARCNALAVSASNEADSAVISNADRPTATERAAAEQVVAAMRAADEGGLKPPLLASAAGPPKPHILALVLALEFGETFCSDRAAKRAFGVGKGTDITAWRWPLIRLFKHSPNVEAAARAGFNVAPAAGDAAPEAARLPLAVAAQPDNEALWWRRGFDAAYSEQDEREDERVRKATAAAITAAERRVAAAEQARDEARAETGKARGEAAKLKNMLRHVCHSYVFMSDSRQEDAQRDAARERARADRAEAACKAYEKTFDDWWPECYGVPEIDDAMFKEHQRMLDARARAMATARQPLPPQQQEENVPWRFLYTCNEADMLKLLQREVERAAARDAEKDKCEKEQALSDAMTVLGQLESVESVSS